MLRFGHAILSHRAYAAAACFLFFGCTSASWQRTGGNPDAALVDEAQVVHNQAAAMMAEPLPLRDVKTDAAPAPAQGASDQIRYGDKLTIDVWMRDRLSQIKGFPIDVETPESGYVFVPHVGNMHVTEFTPDLLQRRLQERFSEILVDASVIVRRSRGEAIGSGRLVGSVRGAMSIDDAPEHIVMMGTVIRPGIYSLGPELRLREALALAGGVDGRRSSANVFVVRGMQDKPDVIEVNINDIFLGRDLSKNILLQDKDAIYVPTKRIVRMADFMSTLLSPIISVRDAIWVYDRFE